MDKDKVLALAKLARLDITDAEAEQLSSEFEGILGYVGEVKKAVASTPLSSNEERGRGEVNIMREDNNPHESGIYTDKILEEAPEKEGNYLKVKNIL